MNPVWHFLNGVPQIGPLTIGPTSVTSTVPLLAPDGSAGAPSYSFASGGSNEGLYLRTSGEMAWSFNGVGQMSFNGGDFQFASGGSLQWLSGALGTSADVSLSRGAANRLDLATGDSFYVVSGGLGVGTTPPASGITTSGAVIATGNLRSDAAIQINGGSTIISSTAPTIASGFGTSPSVVTANGTAAFTINVGTGGTASAGVITMPTAATGWIVNVQNLTAQAANRASVRTTQTATTTTSVTIQNQNVATGAATAWAASDVLSITAIAY